MNLWTVGCADPRLTAQARSPMATLYLTRDEIGDMIVSILQRRITKMREELRALGVDE